jgi:hypothetical protein
MTGSRRDEATRTRRSLAREYRRRGYDVVEQPRGDGLPEFLHDFSPDLVVRKEGDCAVVVIKTREEVIGSNEIVEMAARVDAQPGWRLEFVSLGRRKVAAAGPSEQGLEQLMASALAVYDAGERNLALISLVSVAEELLRDVALEQRIRTRDQDIRTIIGALEFEGLIDEATTSVLERAWERRNELVHGGAAATVGPSRDEMHRIVAACRDVWAARRLQAA